MRLSRILLFAPYVLFRAMAEQSNVKSAPIYFSQIPSIEEKPIFIGNVIYDTFSLKDSTETIEIDIPSEDRFGCFGVKHDEDSENSKFECMSYSKLSSNLTDASINVYLDANGGIQHLDYYNGVEVTLTKKPNFFSQNKPSNKKAASEQVHSKSNSNKQAINIKIISTKPAGPIPALKEPIVLVDNKIPEKEVCGFTFCYHFKLFVSLKPTTHFAFFYSRSLKHSYNNMAFTLFHFFSFLCYQGVVPNKYEFNVLFSINIEYKLWEIVTLQFKRRNVGYRKYTNIIFQVIKNVFPKASVIHRSYKRSIDLNDMFQFKSSVFLFFFYFIFTLSCYLRYKLRP